MNINVLSKKRTAKVIHGYKDGLNDTKHVEPLTDDEAIEDACFMKMLNERENEEHIPILEILRKRRNEITQKKYDKYSDLHNPCK